ncbi:unnamed protein product [Linum trigynum]|uniref:Uncharacterized protein n=1 Tax=Linum trigynum TaxID=586398 RepID=A0AAV2G976_9ROSI
MDGHDSSDKDDAVVDVEAPIAEDLEVSLQALGYGSSTRSLQIPATAGRANLLVLIDTGSNHTFLSREKASELGCRLDSAPPIRVKVANEASLVSDSICTDFQWQMQGKQFGFAVRALELGSLNLVMGLDWVETAVADLGGRPRATAHPSLDPKLV